MGKRRASVLAGVLGAIVLILLVIPVLVTQITPSSRRSLDGVNLADTTYEAVQFRNKVQDLDLAGMLFLPEGAGPYPALVIIHGAGTSRRDNRW